jgi:hypothetical protein
MWLVGLVILNRSHSPQANVEQIVTLQSENKTFHCAYFCPIMLGVYVFNNTRLILFSLSDKDNRDLQCQVLLGHVNPHGGGVASALNGKQTYLGNRNISI